MVAAGAPERSGTGATSEAVADAAAQPPSSSTPSQDQAPAAAPAPAVAPPAVADTERRISRDAADSQATDSPAKAAAASAAAPKVPLSATKAKPASSSSSAVVAAAAAGEPARASGSAEGGRAVRSVAEFAKEVAALQEENRKLKEMLHNQVSPFCRMQAMTVCQVAPYLCAKRQAGRHVTEALVGCL